MRRLVILAVLLTAVAAMAATPNSIKGYLLIGSSRTPLRHVTVVEKAALTKIVMSTIPLTAAEAADSRSLTTRAEAGELSAIVVQLDESRAAEEAFFFDAALPSGLSVRELTRLTTNVSDEKRLGGRVVLDDRGNSFGFEATFLASIEKVAEAIDPLPADASKADHARWRLQQMERDFDEESFRRAVVDGDADAVKLYLEAGMSPETQEALADAVERGNAKVAEVLIAGGANVNKQDAYKQSLVMNAASLGRAEIVRLLIDGGADVSAPNQWKVTPLSAAAEQGHVEIVKMLIAAKAKVNTRTPTGGTALQVAVLRGYTEIVKLLIDAGADVNRDRADLLQMATGNNELRALIENAGKKKIKN